MVFGVLGFRVGSCECYSLSLSGLAGVQSVGKP